MLCDIEPEAKLKLIYLCAEEEWICILHLIESISEVPKTFMNVHFVISNKK